MGKLHLKRTPAEEAERERRNLGKAARKAAKRRLGRDSDDGSDDGVRCSRSHSPRRPKHARVDEALEEDSDYGPKPGPSRSSSDGCEEARFREKMLDAFDEDGFTDPQQRLDGVETHMNAYSYVPRRWKGVDPGFEDALRDMEEEIGLEPWQMNDDEYAAWIRAGIWRKQNHAEIAERRRRKEEREAKARLSRTLREETARLERKERLRREKHKAERARRRLRKARDEYEIKWIRILDQHVAGSIETDLRFEDVPWPIYLAEDRVTDVTRTEDISLDGVSRFLLLDVPDAGADGKTPSAKEILRSTMLRFHPDKFESRVLVRVHARDRVRVKEVAAVVARVVAQLMQENAAKGA